MKFELQGVADVIRNLERVGHNVSPEVEMRALRIAAEPMREEAAILCPRSPYTKEHMADHIIVDASAHTEVQESAVYVGPEERFFYAWMIENGTVHSRAQPFMRPAFDKHVHTSFRILGQLLWVAMAEGLTTSVGGSEDV